MIATATVTAKQIVSIDKALVARPWAVRADRAMGAANCQSIVEVRSSVVIIGQPFHDAPAGVLIGLMFGGNDR
jgi:hypothetical protein